MITIPNIFIAGEAEEVIDEPRPESYSWICLESGTHERMLTDNGTKCGNRFDFTFPVCRLIAHMTKRLHLAATGCVSVGKTSEVSEILGPFSCAHKKDSVIRHEIPVSHDLK